MLAPENEPPGPVPAARGTFPSFCGSPPPSREYRPSAAPRGLRGGRPPPFPIHLRIFLRDGAGQPNPVPRLSFAHRGMEPPMPVHSLPGYVAPARTATVVLTVDGGSARG